MSHSDLQKIIDTPQDYLTTDSMGIKNVNLDNSSPTTMSLYEYVEKHVPSGARKGQIIISEDGEVVDIPVQNNDAGNEEKAATESSSFLARALAAMSFILKVLL